MKKELILHIGMGKTGTTALQDFFWLNRRRLGREGVSYPSYGAVAHAHHLLSPYSPVALKKIWNFKPVEDWAPKLASTRLDKILLSSELIAWSSEAEIEDFCRKVQEQFDIKVVIYVRRQDNIIMANYNQLVKVGLQQNGLDHVLESDIALFDYLRIISPWAKCLGKENVIVRPYERQQFHRGDIRHDFMHHVFGVEFSAEYELPSKDSNPRLHPLAIAYKLRLYKVILDPKIVGNFNDALLSYSREADTSDTGILSSQALLSPSVRNDIIDHSSATNQLIARDYLGRKNGILFYDPLPDSGDRWASGNLTGDDVKKINQHIARVSPELLPVLTEAIGKGLSSTDLLRSSSARFLKASQSRSLLGYVTKHSLRSHFQKRRHDGDTDREHKPQMLISLHLPAVTVEGYLPTVKQQFNDTIVEDYIDRPMSSGHFIRKMNTLRGAFQYARRAYLSDMALCVHGNFLPLKYRFFESRIKKQYVTWMMEPVDRLQSHYTLWRSDFNLESAGELRRRMLDEDWSFETFANCPEIRNIYSMYLWGFPLKLFDFIGIAEFPELEMQRFSRDILGCHEEKMILNDAPQRYDGTTYTIDSQLRSRIERYHSEDVNLYRQALEIRNRKLENFPIVKGWKS
jgi:hypothetical protein